MKFLFWCKTVKFIMCPSCFTLHFINLSLYCGSVFIFWSQMLGSCVDSTTLYWQKEAISHKRFPILSLYTHTHTCIICKYEKTEQLRVYPIQTNVTQQQWVIDAPTFKKKTTNTHTYTYTHTHTQLVLALTLLPFCLVPHDKSDLKSLQVK